MVVFSAKQLAGVGCWGATPCVSCKPPPGLIMPIFMWR